MVPVAFLVAVWHTKTRAPKAKKKSISIAVARAYPWFLFGYFLMAALNTLAYFSAGCQPFFLTLPDPGEAE
jgi:uncharacterized membrane protein YadS